MISNQTRAATFLAAIATTKARLSASRIKPEAVSLNRNEAAVAEACAHFQHLVQVVGAGQNPDVWKACLQDALLQTFDAFDPAPAPKD